MDPNSPPPPNSIQPNDRSSENADSNYYYRRKDNTVANIVLAVSLAITTLGNVWLESREDTFEHERDEIHAHEIELYQPRLNIINRDTPNNAKNYYLTAEEWRRFKKLDSAATARVARSIGR